MLWPFSFFYKQVKSLQENLHADDKHPWRRFFARYIDFYIYVAIISCLSLIFMTFLEFIKMPESQSNLLLIIFIIISYILIEPFFIALLGTTPGKWILGITVLDKNGHKLSISDAMRRTGLVWMKGLAFGLPIISLITMKKAYDSLMIQGQTSWDKAYNVNITFSKISWFKKVILTLVLVSILYLSFMGVAVEVEEKQINHLASDHSQKITKFYSDYNKEANRLINNILVPDNFRDKTYTGIALQKLEKAQFNLDNLTRKIDIQLNNYEKDLKNLQLSNLTKETFTASIEKERNDELSILNSFVIIQQDILNHVATILDFLRQCSGRYLVENGQFIFEDNVDLNKYNLLINELQALAEKEENYIKSLK